VATAAEQALVTSGKNCDKTEYEHSLFRTNELPSEPLIINNFVAKANTN
jgi:hypothetical protein